MVKQSSKSPCGDPFPNKPTPHGDPFMISSQLMTNPYGGWRVYSYVAASLRADPFPKSQHRAEAPSMSRCLL